MFFGSPNSNYITMPSSHTHRPPARQQNDEWSDQSPVSALHIINKSKTLPAFYLQNRTYHYDVYALLSYHIHRIRPIHRKWTQSKARCLRQRLQMALPSPSSSISSREILQTWSAATQAWETSWKRFCLPLRTPKFDQDSPEMAWRFLIKLQHRSERSNR